MTRISHLTIVQISFILTTLVDSMKNKIIESLRGQAKTWLTHLCLEA